jgi:hypothetical protein
MFDGGGIKRCREVPFQVTFQMTTFCIAFYMSHLTTVLGLVLYTGSWFFCYIEKKGFYYSAMPTILRLLAIDTTEGDSLSL